MCTFLSVKSTHKPCNTSLVWIAPFYQERWKLILSCWLVAGLVVSILSREVEANSQQAAERYFSDVHFIKRGGS